MKKSLLLLSIFLLLAGLFFRKDELGGMAFLAFAGGNSNALLILGLMLILVYLVVSTPVIALYSLLKKDLKYILIYLFLLTLVSFPFKFINVPYIWLLILVIAAVIGEKVLPRSKKIFKSKVTPFVCAVVMVLSLTYFFFPNLISTVGIETSLSGGKLPSGEFYFRTASGEIKSIDSRGNIKAKPCGKDFHKVIISPTKNMFYCKKNVTVGEARVAAKGFLINSDDFKEKPVTDLPDGFSPTDDKSWSIDGSSLLFVGDSWGTVDGDFRIINTPLYKLNLQTLQAEKIYPLDERRNERVQYAAFSPDGKKIALVIILDYVNDHGVNVGKRVVKVIDNNGTNEQTIYEEDISNKSPGNSKELPPFKPISWTLSGDKVIVIIEERVRENDNHKVSYAVMQMDIENNTIQELGVSNTNQGLNFDYYPGVDDSVYYTDVQYFVKDVGYTDSPTDYGGNATAVGMKTKIIVQELSKEGNNTVKKTIESPEGYLIVDFKLSNDSEWAIYQLKKTNSTIGSAQNSGPLILEQLNGDQKIKLFNNGESATISKIDYGPVEAILDDPVSHYWFN